MQIRVRILHETWAKAAVSGENLWEVQRYVSRYMNAMKFAEPGVFLLIGQSGSDQVMGVAEISSVDRKVNGDFVIELAKDLPDRLHRSFCGQTSLD